MIEMNKGCARILAQWLIPLFGFNYIVFHLLITSLLVLQFRDFSSLLKSTCQARSMRFADEQAFPLSEVLGDDEVEDVSAGLRLYEE